MDLSSGRQLTVDDIDHVVTKIDVYRYSTSIIDTSYVGDFFVVKNIFTDKYILKSLKIKKGKVKINEKETIVNNERFMKNWINVGLLSDENTLITIMNLVPSLQQICTEAYQFNLLSKTWL